MDIVMANQGGNNNTVMRDYRKGNWTVQETMVLIEAKKMDDDRRMKRQGESSERSSGGGGKPAELRWKWVEDYCWRNGCLRSQNQCNDKWDNLMRDFKKVREYERRLLLLLAEKGDDHDHHDERSYWKLEKNERKAKSLPSNILPQIYEALVDVVERKGQRVVVGGGGGSSSGGGGGSNPNISSTQHPIPIQVAVLPLPPPAQTPAQPPEYPSSLPFSQPLPTVEMCDSSDSDTSEHSDSPAKRRRKGVAAAAGTSGGAATASGGGNTHEIGSAISRSASIIAEAIQACEEREERRHRELLSLHERRLQIEESKAAISRQGINGLVDAVNKLANSILALAAQKNQAASK